MANRWTDVVLLYSEASYSLREGLYLFWGKVSSPSHEKSPLEKVTPSLKTKIESERVTFPTTYSLKCL